MAHNVTPVSAFTTTITVPDDGDSGLGASVESPVQALANRTEYLNDNKIGDVGTSVDNEIPRFSGTGGVTLQQSGLTIDDSADLAFVTPPTRTIYIGHQEAFPRYDSGGLANYYHNSNGWISRVDSASMAVPLPPGKLPHGSTITGASVLCNPGIARVSTSRILFSVVRTGIATAFSGTAVPANSTLASDYDDASADIQVISLAGSDGTLDDATVDHSVYSYYLAVNAGSDGASNQDGVYGFSVTYTDPGPRNH
jgi:hypothetical protein